MRLDFVPTGPMRRSLLSTLSRLTAGAMLFQALAPVALAFQDVSKKGGQKALPMALPPALLRDLPKARAVKPGPHDLRPLPPGTPVRKATPSPTILDERAYLRRGYSETDKLTWRRELWTHPSPVREARLRILLGEYELGKSEPLRAQAQFRRAITLVPASSPDRGLTSYDAALCLFMQGRFPEARHEFRRIMKAPLRGFDRKCAALYAQHASACATYHGLHAEMGIPEPDHLDPLCGAASLASAMRALGLVHDRGELLARVRHNGEGSRLQDLVDALPGLGLSGRVVTADRKGLIASPVPLVAYVEHDHFVTVVDADQKGIEYVCSDCGAWPGGPVRLNWKQWEAMDASVFLAVSRAASPQALALDRLPAKLGGKADRLRLAGRGGEGVAVYAAAQRAINVLAGHMALLGRQGAGPLVGPYQHEWGEYCGARGRSPHCTFQHCPMFELCVPPSGSSAGDPVNLATGEEEYTPAPDLTVYNPKGPSIVWGRTYNSLANTTPSGFGSGWSHTYNWRISKVGSTTTLIMPNAGRVTIVDTGKTAPAPGGVTALSFTNGVPMQIEWRYVQTDPPTGPSLLGYVVTFKDGSKWSFARSTWMPASLYYPNKIQDRFGNAIFLRWDSVTLAQPDPENGSGSGVILNGIFNADGDLLRVNSSNGRINYVTEVPPVGGHGRAVRYQVDAYANNPNLANQNVPSAGVQGLDELTHVSFLRDVTWQGGALAIAGQSTVINERYDYDYSRYSNGERPPPQNVDELVPYLSSISVPSPRGTYDSQGNFTGTWDYTSRSITTLTYGSDGSVATITDANGNITTFTPVLNAGNIAVKTTVVTKSSVANGSKVSLQYSASFDSQMSSVKRMSSLQNDYAPSSGTFTPAVMTYADPNDPYEPDTVTDGNSRVWSMTWDTYGNLLKSKTPKAVETTTVYDTTFFGQPVSVTTQGLTGTTIVYDPTTGVPTSVTAPTPYRSGVASNATQTTTIDPYSTLGNLKEVIEPGNPTLASRPTMLGYGTDAYPERLGLPTYETDAANVNYSVGYDWRANLLQSVDRDANATDYEYNLANQVTKVVLPATGEHGYDRASITYQYAYVGGPLTVLRRYQEGAGATIAAINITEYGREGEVRDTVGTGEAVQYLYDASYRAKEVRTGTAGNWNTQGTRYTYDLAGRVTLEQGPTVATATTTGPYTVNTTYDPAGNVKTTVDGRGYKKTYTYADADGLLTGIAYTNASSGATLSGAYAGYGYDATFSYDAYDRLYSAYNGPEAGSVYYAYDDLGNVKQEQRGYSSYVFFDYQYNRDGSTLRMDVNGTKASNGAPYTYGWDYHYDALGRFASLDSPLGTSSATYTPGGRLTHRSLPNGTFTDFYYYAGNGTGSQSAPKELYHYDKLGNAVSAFGSFQYAPQGPLRQFSTSNGAASAFTGTTTFTYPAPTGGNALTLTGESSSRNGGYGQTHAYDTGINPTTLRGVGQGTYRTDDVPTARGVELRQRRQLQHRRLRPRRGRPTDQRAPRRAGRRGTGRTTAFGRGRRWATSSDLHVLRPGRRADAGDGRADPTALVVTDPEGLVGRWDLATGAQERFYQYDQQGSVAHTTDASGAMVDSRMYDAYGQEAARLPSGASFAPTDGYGFDARWGYVADRENGASASGMPLYYCQNRNYAPNLARWLERDPIGFSGGMNQYAYCAGQPVGNADSSGLYFIILAGGDVRDLIIQHLNMLRTPGSPTAKMMQEYDESDEPTWIDSVPDTTYLGRGIHPGGQGSLCGDSFNYGNQTRGGPHVFYDPRHSYYTNEGAGRSRIPFPPDVVLAHELGHRNPKDPWKEKRPDPTGHTVRPGDVVGQVENPYRAWKKLPKRRYYY